MNLSSTSGAFSSGHVESSGIEESWTLLDRQSNSVGPMFQDPGEKGYRMRETTLFSSQEFGKRTGEEIEKTRKYKPEIFGKFIDRPIPRVAELERTGDIRSGERAGTYKQEDHERKHNDIIDNQKNIIISMRRYPYPHMRRIHSL